MPPRKPASVPTIPPMPSAAAADATATRSEVRGAVEQFHRDVAAEPVGPERMGRVGQGRDERGPTMASGSPGCSSGARSATSASSRPARAPRPAPSPVRSAAARVFMRSGRCADAWVEPAVSDVDHEVDHDHHQRAQEHDAEEKRHVAPTRPLRTPAGPARGWRRRSRPRRCRRASRRTGVRAW